MEKTDFVIANFVVLEDQLIDCMEYIPFINGNKDVISAKFIPIIMDSCSLIDSIFRDFSGQKHEKYNLKKYGDLYEHFLSLDKVISIFLVSPLELLSPYKGWKSSQPEWWKAYNMLKHDRLNNYKVSTYRNAVLSLTGLHQLMSRFKHFTAGFLRAGWIDTQTIEVIEQISSANHLAGLHPAPPNIIIESKLFVSPTRENFVGYDSDDPRFLEVDYDAQGLSNRVRNFLLANEL
jgi:hypothetical protein